MVINNNHTLSDRQINQFWNNVTSEGHHNLRIVFSDGREQYIAVNARTRDFILDILKNGVLIEKEEQYGSDVIDNLNVMDIDSLTITRIVPNRVISNRNGDFFPYLNTTKEDLSKYQIFNQEQAYNQDTVNKREQCLIHTLVQAGVDENLINSVKLSYIQAEAEETVHISIRKRDLQTISNTIKRNITVHTIDLGY